MDDIAKSNANRYLKEKRNVDFIDDSIIKLTHGFDYNNNFRIMLMQLVGIINIEKLEYKLDSTKFHIMKSTLGSLKDCRDRQAHTHIKGTTHIIDSPSVTWNRFQKTYEGLKDIESCIHKMKL